MRRFPAIPVVLLLILGSCASQGSRAGKAAAPAAHGTFRSARFGYTWTLPEQWEFIPAREFGPVPRGTSVEATAARRKGAQLPEAQLLVTDLIAVPPRRKWGVEPSDYDGLENYGRQVLRAFGAKALGSRRVRMAGNDAVEVVGGLGDRKLSIRLLYRGRRQFEFRCLGRADDGAWPCKAAFASFKIADLPPEPAASNAPRVLHLRSARFHFDFDPPDDSWLAVGPLGGGGGAQVVWVWRKGQRQIDVQVLDLSVAPGRPPDEAFLAQRMAAKMQAEGAAVTIGESTLAGARCHHLRVDRADGNKQDMFILNRGSTNYSILVTEPVRDSGLLDQVRRGFKLTAH